MTGHRGSVELRLAEEITEDEMIGEFVRGEVTSPRHGDRLVEAASRLGIDLSIVRRPDCGAENENAARRTLLSEYRGWQQEESVFGGLSTESIRWWRAEVRRETIGDIEVIQWLVDEFPEWFPGRPLRVVRDAALKAGRPHERIARMTRALASGLPPASPIVITTPELDRVVILEGHNRLLAYALLGPTAPDPITVIAGVTARAAAWSEY